MTQSPLTVVGVPTSAGAHYAGQETAPKAFRDGGLIERLRAAGADVVDVGDIPGALFATDQRHPRHRNLEAVVAVARRVADATQHVIAAGRVPLVLGGDCTLTLGVVSGAQREQPDVGLLYFDGDADLTTPTTTRSGILDSMGVSHLLGRADTELAALDRPAPMLADDHLVMLGYNPDDADSFPAGALDAHPGVAHVSGRTLQQSRAEQVPPIVSDLAARTTSVVVHFDVDAVDSSDLPLGNYPHYGVGVTLDVAGRVLAALCSAPRVSAIVLTEVNPGHDPSGRHLQRYLDAVVPAVTAWPAT